MNKIQLLTCLTIGNLIAALAWNFPSNAWNWDDLGEGFRNGVNSLATGESQAQTPLPVPQMEAPNATRHEVFGNAGNQAIEPCAAPPPLSVATRTVEPSPVRHAPNSSKDRWTDRKAKILMNLAPGNQIGSIYSRLHSPDSTDLEEAPQTIHDFWATRDGLIKVSHHDGIVTSIKLVQ